MEPINKDLRDCVPVITVCIHTFRNVRVIFLRCVVKQDTLVWDNQVFQVPFTSWSPLDIHMGVTISDRTLNLWKLELEEDYTPFIDS